MAIIDSRGKVLSNQWVNQEYKHLILEVEEQAAQVNPGQFFNLLCPHTQSDKPFFRRPMSTYNADNQKHQIEFLYKVTGAGTRGLAQLNDGESLGFLGPLGNGFTLQPDWEHILIVGRGVGLATLAPLAEAAAEKNIDVTVILSAKDKARLMSQQRFQNISANLIEVVDEDNSSDITNVENLIRKTQASFAIDAIFTCGSNRLARLLQKLCHEFNCEGQIALEQHMACGLGMCYCCVRPVKIGQKLLSKRVCFDGPIFNLKEVVL